MEQAHQFREWTQQFADESGFDLCGVAAVRDEDFAELKYFPEWIANGHAGEMEYLKARNEQGELKRASLRNAAPWARSVIVCALNYNTDQPLSTDPHKPNLGWISRYAWFQKPDSAKGTDYHDAVLRRLREMEAKLHEKWKQHDPGVGLETRCYVDTGPIVERVYAKYAGIGWIGKNTCIIHQEKGSWLFLGVILTSVDLGEAIQPPLATDRCGSCTRCIDACPTAAITPYRLDATKCISYLTIEKRGTIPEDLREKMGRHIFGCDICQDVCPWNGAESATRRAPVSSAPEFKVRPELVNPALDWLAEMNHEDSNRSFKDSPVKRAKYQGIRRNIAIAMGNSGEQAFKPILASMGQDEDEIVAEHAKWALNRLSQASKH